MIKDKKYVGNKPIVISLEGIDGAGKTTLINLLSSRLGNSVVVYSRCKKSAFVKKVLSFRFIKKIRIIQLPIYVFLANRNYKSIEKSIDENTKVVLMDRCFLSNICYYLPLTMHCNPLFQLLMLTEPPIIPEKIFIVDVDPEVAMERDNYSKAFDWYVSANNNYKKAFNSKSFQKYGIEILKESLTVGGKVDYIFSYIRNRNNCI